MLTDLVLATALVLAGVALALAAYTYSGRLERQIEDREGSGVRIFSVVLVALRRPVLIGIAAASIYLAVRYVLELHLDYPWLNDQRYPVAVAILLVTWGIANILSRLTSQYGHEFMQRAGEEYDPRLLDLLAVGVRYLVWFIAVLYLLNYLDVSITPLIAGAGIAGIAVALAAQDVLSNLLGGVIIVLDRPLSIGDKVRVDPYTGNVVRIGLRSTRIRTADGLVVTIPNSRITSNIVVNFSTGDPRTIILVPVTVDNSSSVERNRTVLQGILDQVSVGAPPAWELGETSVLLSEISRFGPVFLLKVRVREEVDQNAVRDLVLSGVAQAVWERRIIVPISPGYRDNLDSSDKSAPGIINRFEP